MITLHEVTESKNKTIASFNGPAELMKAMGFTLAETRKLLDVAAKTDDGQIPPEPDLVTRKYFITFNDDFMIGLGIAATIEERGSLDDKEISEIIGIDRDNVVRIRKSALGKMESSGELRKFAELIAELSSRRNNYHQFEIVENTEIKITIS